MNMETLLFLVLIFISLNVLVWKLPHHGVSKSARTKSFLFLWLAGAVFALILLYRFGVFGHFDFIDGKLENTSTLSSPPKKVVPPVLDTPKSSVWKDAQEEHNRTLDSFSPPRLDGDKP